MESSLAILTLTIDVSVVIRNFLWLCIFRGDSLAAVLTSRRLVYCKVLGIVPASPDCQAAINNLSGTPYFVLLSILGDMNPKTAVV